MKKRQILALLISTVFLGIIFHKIDWMKLLQTFKMFNLTSLWMIIPIYISTLYLRGIRWKALLLDNPKYSAYNLGAIFTVGSMLNVFLPARAGDVYRAYYLGSEKQEKKMKLFGSIILERTLDGICIFMILLAAVILYSKQAWMFHLTYIIGALFIGAFTAFYFVFKFNKINFICSKLVVICKKFPKPLSNPLVKIVNSANVHINSFIDGFEVLNSIKYSAVSFGMSLIIWLFECYVAFLIINSFHMSLGFSAALFVISLVSFSTMIPSTSMFLGPYQYAYILALGIYNVDKSTALAVSAVHQAILMLILTAIGGFYLLKFNFSIREAEQEFEAAEKQIDNITLN